MNEHGMKVAAVSVPAFEFCTDEDETGLSPRWPIERRVPRSENGLSHAKHCDEYIHDLQASKSLRFFLLVNRLPASDSLLLKENGVNPTLFADYNSLRVRVVMASRLGDVGITSYLDSDKYNVRVLVEDLSNFGTEP